MAQKAKSENLPNWVNPLLQGLAFWLGYKKEYYRHYPLSEGAIIGEGVELISANLGDNLQLLCEYGYKNIPGLKGMAKDRIDLAIRQKPKNDKAKDKLEYAIEVKRYESSYMQIDEDLKRLYAIKKSNNAIRCFLLIVSQYAIPRRFIDDKKREFIAGDIKKYNDEQYRVRVKRVCKAFSSFRQESSPKSGHYACLLEVLLPNK